MDRRVLWIAGAGIAIVVVGRPRSSPDAAAGTPAASVSSAPSPVRGTARVARASLAELGARIAVARRVDIGGSFLEDVEVIGDAGATAVHDLDISSTITIDPDYIRNIPVGRTFESVLGAAVDDADPAGVSFSGVTTLENTYIIDF